VYSPSRRFYFIALSALMATLLCSRIASAEEPSCSSPSPDCAVVGELDVSLSLGFGQRSNPVADKSGTPLLVIPRISYYGKRFFLENLDFGFTAYEGESNTFSLLATPGYDRAFFFSDDPQNIFVAGGTVFQTGMVAPAPGVEIPVKKRRTTYLLGPEWTFGYGRLTGQLNALREVTGRHEGYELRGAFSVPLLRSKGLLTAGAGFTWKSAEVVRYYYGIDGLYVPGAAFNPFVKMSYSLPLSDRASNRWTVNAFAQYEHLAGAIANSPVLAEDHVTTFFAGVAFRVH
jgi:outer membrane protein